MSPAPLPRLQAPREIPPLANGTATIDARNAAPVRVVTGDTKVNIASSKVEVSSRGGVVTMVRVFAGSAQVDYSGKRQVVVAGDVWVRPAEPTATAGESLHAFEQGWAALRASQYAEAIAAFDRARDPVVAEDAAFWAAIASSRAGDRASAARRLRDFMTRFPGSTRSDAARQALARLAITDP
jgi:TolA-binding protein